MLMLTLLACATAPRSVEPVEPTSRWRQDSGWSGACFEPPAFDALSGEALEKARRDTLSAMYVQWRGARSDGVQMDNALAGEVASLLKERLAKVDAVAAENFDHCVAVMSEGTATIAWGNWLASLPASLTEGECATPFEEDWFHHLEVDQGWQGDLRLCGGESIRILADTGDAYQIVRDGRWIDVTGTGEAAGAGYPCADEGCGVGMLVARFDGASGESWTFPVGAEATWETPEDGVLSLSVNDTDWADNRWRTTEDRVLQQAGIQISKAR